MRSVDRFPVGTGKRGPITTQLQKAFFGLFDGTTEDTRGWLDVIEAGRYAQPSAEAATPSAGAQTHPNA